MRAISITFDLGGRKSPIRKFNFTATNSETQCAEGHRGFLKGATASGIREANLLHFNHDLSPLSSVLLVRFLPLWAENERPLLTSVTFQPKQTTPLLRNGGYPPRTQNRLFYQLSINYTTKHPHCQTFLCKSSSVHKKFTYISLSFFGQALPKLSII